MNSTAEITTDPLLFDKLLAPLEATLQTLDGEPLSQAAKKLTLRLFVRVLLFRLFAQCGSLGNLVLDLRTKHEARRLGLPVLGLATIHDAFVRYPHAWFVALTQAVLRSGVLLPRPELAAFGPLWCVDSSWWPLVRQLGWLQRDGYQGVRLHLGLSLNLVCPAAFLLSYDKSPTSSERQSLLALLTAGGTYITERGYVSLLLYREVMEAGAFFVIRERHNLRSRVLALLDVTRAGLTSAPLLSGCRDEIIQLTRDEAGTVLRLVSFQCGTHAFRLVTNRLDLTTAQIIRLYAWRWQVELLFRAWKHTLGALHLINLSGDWIAIQFQVLLLASLLWTVLQQTASGAAGGGARHPVAQTSAYVDGAVESSVTSALAAAAIRLTGAGELFSATARGLSGRMDEAQTMKHRCYYQIARRRLLTTSLICAPSPSLLRLALFAPACADSTPRSPSLFRSLERLAGQTRQKLPTTAPQGSRTKQKCCGAGMRLQFVAAFACTSTL